MSIGRPDREDRALARFVARHFPPRAYKRVADVAGGRGYLAAELARRGYRVTVVDPLAGGAAPLRWLRAPARDARGRRIAPWRRRRLDARNARRYALSAKRTQAHRAHLRALGVKCWRRRFTPELARSYDLVVAQRPCSAVAVVAAAARRVPVVLLPCSGGCLGSRAGVGVEAAWRRAGAPVRRARVAGASRCVLWTPGALASDMLASSALASGVLARSG